MYSAGLAFYYVATVRYNWSGRRMARTEKLMHVIFWSLGFGKACTGLRLTIYNNTDNWICAISHKPLFCLDSLKLGKESANCERGDNAYVYKWALNFCFVWLSCIFMVSCLTSVYLSVLKQERRRDSYHFTSGFFDTEAEVPSQQLEQDRRKSRRIFEQGLLYTIAFILTQVFYTTTRILSLTHVPVHISLIILNATFIPLQGLWNFLIYNRDFRMSLFSTLVQHLCFCWGDNMQEDNNNNNDIFSSRNDNSNNGPQRMFSRSFRVSRKNGPGCTTRNGSDDNRQNDDMRVVDKNANNTSPTTTTVLDKNVHEIQLVEDEKEVDGAESNLTRLPME